eukprot:TRINITY_DN27867_c0_g1_i1.p2 TRINITY_DN27867_c0_g1~~TRINITY_DN27867_c0_g1_i1.p2  ORF type:complete len:101 (-),score=12.34 TRINITY_DN27867_c0_g1_i1:313-615(-)
MLSFSSTAKTPPQHHNHHLHHSSPLSLFHLNLLSPTAEHHGHLSNLSCFFSSPFFTIHEIKTAPRSQPAITVPASPTETNPLIWPIQSTHPLWGSRCSTD